jgi:hypothetical protein
MSRLEADTPETNSLLRLLACMAPRPAVIATAGEVEGKNRACAGTVHTLRTTGLRR